MSVMGGNKQCQHAEEACRTLQLVVVCLVAGQRLGWGGVLSRSRVILLLFHGLGGARGSDQRSIEEHEQCSCCRGGSHGHGHC
jgi:hypothetical protein